MRDFEMHDYDVQLNEDLDFESDEGIGTNY